MIIKGESIESYHAQNAVSKSKAKTYLEHGPGHYRGQYFDGIIKGKESRALDEGLMLDCVITEGWSEFENRYVIKPSGMKLNTKEGKAFADENTDREIISTEDHQILLHCVAAITSNPLARRLMEGCDNQVTIRGKAHPMDIVVQSRPDFINTKPSVTQNSGRPYLLDLKKVASLDRFPNQVIDFGYHMQIAIGQWLLAREGIQCDGYLIACEWKLCPRCLVYSLPEKALNGGWVQFSETVQKINDHISSGSWSVEQKEIIEIVLPSWQERKLDAVIG